MAKYKKRKDGRYATSFIIGYTDDGKPKRRVLYGRTILELDNKVAEFKSLQNKGIIIDDQSLTVEAWAKKWLELYKQDKAYNTYAMYKNALETHIIPQIGAIRLSALKKHNLQEILNNLVNDGKLRSAEIVRLTLRQIIHQAICQEYLYKDVSVGLSLPKHIKPQKRALTDAELELIKSANLSPKERIFLDILYYTGLRKGEALALTVGDIDLVNKTLTVNKNLVFVGNTSQIKPSPKSDAGNRTLPLPSPLIKSLAAYIKQLDNMYLFTQLTNSNLMSKSSFRRFWDDLIDKLNIAAGGEACTRKSGIRFIAPDITPHLFRHTYATNLYYADIDVKTAQYLLGHSSIQMTMDIYTHLDDSKITAANSKLDNFFNSKNNCSDSQNIVSEG